MDEFKKEKLKELREELGFTQVDLAVELLEKLLKDTEKT